MRLIPVLLLATFVAACAPPKAVEIRTGESCWRCRRPIVKTALAGEFVTTDGTGLASKFRTVHCMATWIGQQAEAPQGVFYVKNYANNKWIRAEDAVFVRTVVDKNSLERDFIAFASAEDAAGQALEGADAPVDWQSVLKMGREHPLGGN